MMKNELFYRGFPLKLFNVFKEPQAVSEDKELNYQLQLNAELLRICQQQRRLIDEQSVMIVEMLEEMGR